MANNLNSHTSPGHAARLSRGRHVIRASSWAGSIQSEGTPHSLRQTTRPSLCQAAANLIPRRCSTRKFSLHTGFTLDSLQPHTLMSPRPSPADPISPRTFPEIKTLAFSSEWDTPGTKSLPSSNAYRKYNGSKPEQAGVRSMCPTLRDNNNPRIWGTPHWPKAPE